MATDYAARLTALLEDRYGARIAGLVPFYEGTEKAIYRVDRPDGPAWVVRHFPETRRLERGLGDAAVLRHVELHGVPAERLVAAADGSWAVDLDSRGVLVTWHIRGDRPDRSSDTLRRLGETVGRLHAIPSVPTDDPFLSRRASALPKEDLAFGRSCLARVAGRVPGVRLGEYDALWAALDLTNDCEDLPRGLIHSDGHLANALRTPDGEVVLFDWDGAGQGPRVAALGLLLFTSAIQAPDDPFVPPDLRRVDAVLAGYNRHHVLTPDELDRLPDAVRFRPVVLAARNLAASIEQGQVGDLTGWWNRFAEANAVATRARQVVTHQL